MTDVLEDVTLKEYKGKVDELFNTLVDRLTVINEYSTTLKDNHKKIAEDVRSDFEAIEISSINSIMAFKTAEEAYGILNAKSQDELTKRLDKPVSESYKKEALLIVETLKDKLTNKLSTIRELIQRFDLEALRQIDNTIGEYLHKIDESVTNIFRAIGNAYRNLGIITQTSDEKSVETQIIKYEKGNTYKILLVEDEDQIARMIIRLFENSGIDFKVERVANYQEAIAALKGEMSSCTNITYSGHQNYAAIVTDMRFPGGNGAKVAKEARKLGFDRRIVFASGQDLEQAKESTKGMINIGYLNKPFDPNKLVPALEGKYTE